MPASDAVWGIEIGQCALKAIKLRAVSPTQVELLAFDVVEHPRILSQPDANADELIRAALEKFASRNDWQRDRFVIGVPGQQTFARFCKLPPVDEKKIPDIVRFEASQQIPFDMEDVVWDYEVFRDPGSPEVEVGIFAMRKDLVRRQIEFFSHLRMVPTIVQTIPCALYNFARFDQPRPAEKTALVVIDVGAQNTDLVIVEPHGAWTRNIPLGGNNFTEALIKAFKLSFAKAESLKRGAATSKYARQIFQAMRPVFAELVAEVQRSIGFYSSTHRDVELQRVLACGNAFRLPGLQKYLENNLTIPGGVQKLEKFESLAPGAPNAAQFMEHALSFAAAYGLALQGLGLGAISANLVPPELARVALWKQKRPYFVAAAACLGVAAALPWTRSALDRGALAANRALGEQARQIVEQARAFNREYSQVATDTSGKREKVEKLLALGKDRTLVPALLAFIHQALPTDPTLAQVQSPEELRKLIEQDRARYERSRRKQMIIESLRIEYVPNIDQFDVTRASGGTSIASAGGAAEFGGGAAIVGDGGGLVSDAGPVTPARPATPAPQAAESGAAAGFYVRIVGRSTFGTSSPEAMRLITDEFYRNLLTLGSRPGLGFHVPEEDPMRPDKRNLGTPTVVPYDPKAAGGSPLAGPASGGGGGEAISVEAMGTVGGPAVTPGGVPTPPANVDPVTGEDISKDWRFEVGFKIKLGDKPQPAPDASGGKG